MRLSSPACCSNFMCMFIKARRRNTFGGNRPKNDRETKEVEEVVNGVKTDRFYGDLIGTGTAYATMR